MITRLAGQGPVPRYLSEASRADSGMVVRLREKARSPPKFMGDEAGLRSSQEHELASQGQDLVRLQ